MSSKAASSSSSSAAKKDIKEQWVIAPTEPIEKFYTLGQRLGQPGQFGYAVLATHKTAGHVRAVKVISKARFSRQADIKYHYDQLRSEIQVMQKMSHPNICKLYEVYESPSDVYLVLECAQGGELFDRIKDAGAFSEKQASTILRQMCEGLKYMHENKIAHCDLKPDNFLMQSAESDKVLIIDFGMSKFVQNRQYFEQISGTPYYVAPEVIQGRYCEHCDMWSLGVVMFVMLFGYPCFYVDQETYGSETDDRIFKLISKGFNPSTLPGFGNHFPASIPASESAKDLIAKLLTMDTAKRLTAAEALDHPWLTGKTASDKPILANVLNSLKQFQAKQKFKVGVLAMMSDSLSDDEIEQLKQTFAQLDANGDGKITLTELKQAVAKGGSNLVSSAAEIEKLLKLADVDGDGVLSYEELLLTCVQRKLAAKEERIWEAFQRLDLDGDGRVTLAEIETVMKANSQDARKFIAEVDKDGDGCVSYDEFITMWRNQEKADSEAKTPRK